MIRILLSHPHAGLVASQCAAALDRAGALAAYFTGIAAGPGTLRYAVLSRLAERVPRLRNRLLERGTGRALWPMWSVEIAARALAGLGRRKAYDDLFVLHDAAVAARAWPGDATAVYAYEDGALRTFRKAADRGMRRIWDLPLPHWRTLEGMWTEEAARWPGAMGARPPVEPDWKKVRKDEELALADSVCVASRFTRESLEAAGCRKPVVQVPYGFPVETFGQRELRPAGPFTVLAVGTHDLRKGTPYLLEAWRRLALPDARLRLVGPLRLSESFLARYRGSFEHEANVPRSLLHREYSSADLLAFPTLGDGFGLVIQEAMSCGLPVVTTRCGGGPECIADGVDGWLVPERNVDALAERIEWAHRDREAAWRMGVEARRRAEKWPWPEANRAIARALCGAEAAGAPAPGGLTQAR